MVVVPAAILGPWVASWVAGWISRTGPLARTGLMIDPQPVRAAWFGVAVAALVTVALFSWPTYRQARAAQRAADGVRQRSRSSAQRAGVDVAVAVFAAVAIWQLSTLGDERTARLRGRFGVDPLLVVAPALGLFAGAFIALRIVPMIARVAERLAARTRSAVPALAGWQVARRPARYARSSLLLIMAVALGVFATTYQSTWERSQEDQARHQAGADLRVEPNRRTNDSITDLHLRAAYEQVADVDTAMPVVRRRGVLPNAELPAEIVLLDVASASDVVLGDPSLADAWAALADASGALPAAMLPDGATAIELSIAVTELDEPSDDEPVPVLDAAVVVVISDAHGLLHRLPVGAVSSGAEPVTLTAALDLDEPVRSQVSWPIGIVDIEFRTEVPTDRSRSARIDVLALDAVNDAGDSVPIVTNRWTFSRTSVGPLDEFPGIAAAIGGPERVVGATVVTGRAFSGATTTYAIRPVGDPRPTSIGVVVGQDWFEANERSIGDPVRIDALADVSGRIVGTVEAFPTIRPDEAHVVIADLGTVVAATYELGASFVSVEEMWLDLDGDDTSSAAAVLEAEPYEAVSTIGNDDRAAALLADPPAVGTIGALSIGFVTAAVLAVVGFLIAATVSARDRAGEFALLRALGLTGRQLAAWTFVEQAALIVFSLAIGTCVGLGLSALVLPAVSLTAGGGEVFPPVEVIYPWSSILAVQIVVLVGLVAAVSGINLALRRLAVARQLRAGAT